MRVLLVYPKRDPQSQVRTQFSMERIHDLTFWPLRGKSYGLQFNGLEALAALTPDWVQLTVINENLRELDLEANVDLVAITVMVTNATRAYQIADHFRRRNIKVVMGGYHPFMIPQNSLAHADAICTTEAEYVWEDMLKDARDGRLKPIYEQTQKTDMSKCVHIPRVRRWEWLHQVSLTLQASRGCPFSCDFCSIVQMLGHDMRYKSPENLCRELEVIFKNDLMGRIFYRPIFFVDDNIFGHPRTMKELLRAIIKLRARYPKFRPVFGSQMTINVYKDKEALALLEEAGFYNIFMGLESQDPETLRSYNKLHNIAFKYDDAIRTMREHGMEVIASFIFGTDSDSLASFDSAYDFFDRCDVLYPYFNILTPTANQWKRFLGEGRILTVKAKLYDAHHTVFVPMKMTPRQLQEGFIRLVSRTFDYSNIAKRMRGIYVDHPQRDAKLRLPLVMEKFLYYKLHLTLGMRDDRAGQSFLEELRPHIFTGQIPIASVLLQIDQHDWAVHNTQTLAEHRYSLDVPAWQERAPDSGTSTGLVEMIAEQVR
ncbi:MAG TPA: radical SAM protein [Terriglobales bacterium]|nr:radical SAM protein [Terriglobales bacterium]